MAPSTDRAFEHVLCVARVVLDGRTALPLQRCPQGASEVEPVVDALWSRGFLIEVLDGSTDRHLSGIEVRYSEFLANEVDFALGEVGFRRQFDADGVRRRPLLQRMLGPKERFQRICLAPPPSPRRELLLVDGTSPIVLDLIDVTGTYWLTAPGYAWERWSPLQEEATPEGNVPTVRLRPAARLEVTIEGEHALAERDASTLVRVYSRRIDPNVPVAEKAARETPVFFEHLPSGKYGISLERGRLGAATILANMEDVELAAGSLERVTLLVRSPAELEKAALVQGVIRQAGGAAAWWVGSLELSSLDPAGRDTVRLDASRRVGREDISWGPVAVHPGRYRLDIVPARTAVAVELVPGTNDVAIDLPERRPRRIYVLDSVTGRRIAADTVRVEWEWFSDKQARDSLQDTTRVLWPEHPTANPFPLDLPSCLIVLRIHAEGYESVETGVVVQPGQDEVVVQLEPVTAVRLVVEHLGQEVPFSSDWLSKVRTLNKEGQLLQHTTSWRAPINEHPRGTLLIRGVGRCTVHVPPLPGLPPLGTATVELRPGGQLVARVSTGEQF